MHKSFAIYVGLLFLLVVVIAGVQVSWSDFARDTRYISLVSITIFGLLAHAPSLLPVASQRSLFGPSPKWMSPSENFYPPLIWASWILTGFVIDHVFLYTIAGLAAAAGVTAGYVAVRANAKAAQAVRLVAAPNPRPQTARLMALGARYAYVMRATAAAASLLGMLAALTCGGTSALWAAPCVVLMGGAALSIVALAAHSARDQARGAQRTASAAIGLEERKNGTAEVALYCSAKAGSKHVRIEMINKALLGEGLTTAIIARETHSLKKLNTFGATHLWFAPYLAGLDALARPSLRAAFYTHDGSKNGHFVRFNHFAHILDAGTGTIAQADHVTNVLNMYDYVIAPNCATAAIWRDTAEPAWQGRILTVNRNVLQILPKDQPIGPSANIAVSVRASGGQASQMTPELVARLKALVSRFYTVSEAVEVPDPEAAPQKPLNLRLVSKLLISVASDKAGIMSTWQKEIVNLGDEESVPLISHAFGPSSDVWDEADIIIVIASEDVDHLRTTGKPLLWLGSGPAPDGTVAFDPMKRETPYEVAARAVRPVPSPLHFTSYRALLDYVDKNRETQPDGATT